MMTIVVDREDYPGAIVEAGHVEPVPRRIRAELGGQVVLDTTRALYMWEWPFYPQFHIPVGDVDAAALIDGGPAHRLRHGTVVTVGLRAGGVERPRAGRRYVESPIAEIVDHVRFEWDALEGWFEEDEQVFVHPRNPYVRVDALRSTRHVRIERETALCSHRAPPPCSCSRRAFPHAITSTVRRSTSLACARVTRSQPARTKA